MKEKTADKINSKTFDMIDNKNIKEITIRKVGLLDVFGKVLIDIKFNNNSEKHLEGISPVDTNAIKKWLERDNLYEKAKLYEF
nr:MAG TPA: hypothetical protein [Caudoviricetes sp.]